MPMIENTKKVRRARAMRGFSLIEVCVVVLVAVTIMGMALPSVMSTVRSYRAMGDARKISGALSMARMRSAADFTQTRLFLNLTKNTYRIDIWNKAGNVSNPTGCWQTEAATSAAPCDATTSASSTVGADTPFGGGSVAGVGSASTAPPSTQTTFGQAPTCLNNAGSSISSTGCIVFNSRGIPVTPGNPLATNNTATSNDAIYFSTQTGTTYGVEVLATGKISVWAYNNSSWVQQ